MRNKAIVVIILICTLLITLVGIFFIVKNIRTVKPEEENTSATSEVIDMNNEVSDNADTNAKDENTIGEQEEVEISPTEEIEYEVHSGSGVSSNIDPQDNKWLTKILFLVHRNYHPYSDITEDSILYQISKIEVYKPHNGTADIYAIFEDGGIDNIVMSQFDTDSEVSYLYIDNVSSKSKKRVTAGQVGIEVSKEIIEQYIDAMKNSYYISDYSLSSNNIEEDRTKSYNSYLVSMLTLPSQFNIKRDNLILENIMWLYGIKGAFDEQNLPFEDITKIEIYYNNISNIAVFKCTKENGDYVLLHNTYIAISGSNENLLVNYNFIDNSSLTCVTENAKLLGSVNNPNEIITDNKFMSITETLKGE